MKRLLSNAFLAVLISIGTATLVFASDPDPIVGIWKLNLAKSAFAGIPPLKSQTRTYSGPDRNSLW